MGQGMIIVSVSRRNHAAAKGPRDGSNLAQRSRVTKPSKPVNLSKDIELSKFLMSGMEAREYVIRTVFNRVTQ
jgi:hypothetical protein